MTYQEMQEQAYKITDKILLDNERLILSRYKSARAEVLQIVKDLYANHLSGVKPDEYFTTASQYNRLKKADRKIKAVFVSLARDEYKATAAKQDELFTEQYYRQQFSTMLFANDVRFSKLSPVVTELSVTGDIEVWKGIRNKALKDDLKILIPASGKTLKQTILDNDTMSLIKIQQTVKQGLINGVAYNKQVDALKSTFDNSYTNALRVVHTEGNRNQNAAAYWQTQQSAKQVPLKRRWLATRDDRTRDRHIELDGQVVGVNEPFKLNGMSAMYPGDFGEPSMDINCFPGFVNVGYAKAERAYRRYYEGAVLSFETSKHIKFTVTPNHPVLTKKGWVAAKLIGAGDDIVCMRFGEFGNVRKGNINNKPTMFTKVFDLISIAGSSKRVSNARKQFHGDWFDSDVDVVFVTSKLWNRIKASIFKHVNKIKFTSADILESGLSCDCFSGEFGISPLRSTNSIMSFFRKSKPFFWRAFGHPKIHGFTPVSWSDPTLFNDSRDNISGNREHRSKRLDRFSRAVETDKVISVDRSDFSGHVYNLQTFSNWYIVSNNDIKNNDSVGVVVHNCRCAVTDIIEGLEPNVQRVRNPVTGRTEIATYGSYEEYKKTYLEG